MLYTLLAAKTLKLYEFTIALVRSCSACVCQVSSSGLKDSCMLASARCVPMYFVLLLMSTAVGHAKMMTASALYFPCLLPTTLSIAVSQSASTN